MQVHNLTQGSAEWHAYRRDHFNASDAPAMMGCSPYKTRDALIVELATGIAPDVDPALQKRFDDGHRFEALARPIAEGIIGEELAPLVGSEGKYSASFDGLTLMEDTAFEHKSLNNDLRACMAEGCQGAALPLVYRVQMEQQCMVSGAQRVLFMASKWSGDQLVEERHCWYTPDPALRATIVAGWAQLEKDVAAYVVPDAAPAQVVAEVVTALPTVFAQVSGQLALQDNLPEFEVALRDFIEHRLIRKPESDQDFANLDLQIKALKGAEAALEASEEQALSQAAMLSAFKRTKDMLHALAREHRLAAEKLLKAEKERIKSDQMQRGQKALADHIAALNARLGKPYMPAVASDFAGAISGKRTVDSLRSAVNDELARAKMAASEIADRIQINLASLRELAAGHAFLFADAPQLVMKANDDLLVLIKSRIAEHEAKEAERERIRAEEQAKAQREAAAAAAQREREQQEEHRRQLVAAERAAQTGIAEARVADALPAPLLDALAAVATHVRDSGVADIDAQRAIGAAQDSSAAAPVMSPKVKCDGDHAGPACSDPECWNGSTVTLGQINTLLAPIKLDAAGLEALGFATTRVKAAVHLPAAHFSKLCRAVAERALAAIEKGIPA